MTQYLLYVLNREMRPTETRKKIKRITDGEKRKEEDKKKYEEKKKKEDRKREGKKEERRREGKKEEKEKEARKERFVHFYISFLDYYIKLHKLLTKYFIYMYT